LQKAKRADFDREERECKPSSVRSAKSQQANSKEEKAETTFKVGITFDFIDIGGSLGVPYRPHEEEIDLHEVARRVTGKLREKLEEYEMGEPFLIHEPGRFLVADAGLLISQVTSIKDGYKKFIGLNASMSTLLRPALYGAYHEILWRNDLNAPLNTLVNVVGQVCENSDVFAKDRPLSSKVSVDDFLVFSDDRGLWLFNELSIQYQPKAAEILVKIGQARLIRKRETFEDLIKKVTKYGF
jgi:diaminopimelate decarboxylase